MGKGCLTSAQLALATAFFRSRPDFFLTGGAVLAGWELGHRGTDDLDLFTERDDAVELGAHTLKAVVAQLGGRLEQLVTTPDFKRYLATIGDEQVKIDLVRDRAPQLFPKVERDGIRMDPAEEIFVNKICTLVARSEVRDVIDLMALEARGLRVEQYLELARKKDAGVTPATLAWLLSSLHVPERLPGEADRGLVIDFIRQLERRMALAAVPKP